MPAALVGTLADVGYEAPSPIQAATIPPLLEGRDLLGQAQTGTGKTAAFALPILARLDLARAGPQALVLAPTRELAIQVAEAFQRYAARLPGFHVLPIYGGQSYEPQIRGLRRGVHVVVGTPGRMVDHLKRGTLRLDGLRWLVLDEADEMLRMGFVEDIEWILGQAPAQRQIALFSATMPAPIRRIAQTHLHKPAEITIKSKTTTAANIRQRCWLVSGMHKLDALTRILEAEPFEAMIVFARTKLATEELATKLQARGFDAAALNGDVQQAQRERIVGRLRDGSLDILVATDVAARGLDVERISHVVNYDVPTDPESYVHRIGRTGRAGRSGEAILFIAPRERHLLRAIERATRQPIEAMALPSTEVVNAQRIARFKQRITEALESPASRGQLLQLQTVVGQYAQERGVPLLDVAAALASIIQGSASLLLEPEEPSARTDTATREATQARREADPRAQPATKPRERARPRAEATETYRVEVGLRHGLKPGNLVGAIANEAGVDGQHIGRIDIRDDHSFIELPPGMPKAIFRDLQKVWVAGRQLRISRVDAPPPKRSKA
ncbi:MAG: DEAD/DEAH box helicase [Pseudomonadota bacterium]